MITSLPPISVTTDQPWYLHLILTTMISVTSRPTPLIYAEAEWHALPSALHVRHIHAPLIASASPLLRLSSDPFRAPERAAFYVETDVLLPDPDAQVTPEAWSGPWALYLTTESGLGHEPDNPGGALLWHLQRRALSAWTDLQAHATPQTDPLALGHTLLRALIGPLQNNTAIWQGRAAL